MSVGSGPVHTGEITAGDSYPFEVTIPNNALPAYRSRHGELYWEVDARSDEFGRDTHARRRIDVSPTR